MARNSSARRKNLSALREWMRAFGFALSVLFLLKWVILDIARIPTGSMENAVLPGDVLLMSKLHYGPRLPITPLSAPYGEGVYSTLIQFPYLRLPGFTSVTYQDIIVFNHPGQKHHPADMRTILLKRVLGLPGDSIQIKDAAVWANNTRVSVPTARLTHTLKTSEAIPDTILQIAQYRDLPGKLDQNHLLITPDSFQFEIFARYYGANALSLLINEPTEQDRLRENMAKYGWNDDQFGPLYIPKRGDTLQLSGPHSRYYLDLIRDFENVRFEEINGEVFIDDLNPIYYVFKYNYYFVMGDNRHDSVDSRTWGLLPETHILGKALFCLFSVDVNSRNWRINRIFKWLK